MSYLEMESASLPDMSSGIISLWFREISKQTKNPPPSAQWPQGFWTDANAGEVMVPPNAQFSVGYDPAYGGSPVGPPNRTPANSTLFFWNAYGLPVGGEFFGDAFLGPAACWIPNSPPVPLNTMSGTGWPSSDTVADNPGDMSRFGIRTLLTFGDPNIDYMYCSWRIEDPGVIKAVQSADSMGFVVYINPPPYRFYYTHGGDGSGKWAVRNYRINGPQSKGKVPPSFIGIDNDGHVVINLQTNTKATYSGMAFEMSRIKELWGSCTSWIEDGPPFSYTQIGFPFPDGHWVSVGGYWNGYEFEYQDVSQQVMGCAPESFLIHSAQAGFLDFFTSGPVVNDDKWHHLLFSFDINGAVSVIQPTGGSPSVNTGCKAWMAFDDKNITGASLQNRPQVHDGFILPHLRGTETTQILDCGPCTSFGRNSLSGDNDILPRNAWLTGFSGNPKDGLVQYASDAGVITDSDDKTNNTARMWGGKNGDFNWMFWTGAIWPLYGHGVSPGPWQATFQPPAPTTPDPKTFDVPSYSAAGFTIPAKGHPIGIPGRSSTPGFPPGGKPSPPSSMLDYNTGVEMAELQIWANKKLDTSDEKMRRLFIDKKGKAVSPKQAENVLGKPDILLHGSGNWRSGRNTGSTGGPKGTHFKPTAKINPFVPNPELGK